MELEIDGMTCGHCSSAVKQALERVDGVEEASVDLAAGRAVVRGVPQVSALLRAVEDEGYRARPIPS
jgi:copper chaperone